eukprot:CAMPEP_0179213508 /NCGR_PEP_ID=MMETSP0797-20121207/1730_1 /TAXON_ID=47934 /ORGANISM="Dinophysis acuminata, Strain DAEP01" /LENGTH=141 /DNA_ID=CAMNT_0020919299 /DNA_START=413 /DNA_END=836 /DNA_ORIENTATION=+
MSRRARGALRLLRVAGPARARVAGARAPRSVNLDPQAAGPGRVLSRRRQPAGDAGARALRCEFVACIMADEAGCVWAEGLRVVLSAADVGSGCVAKVAHVCPTACCGGVAAQLSDPDDDGHVVDDTCGNDAHLARRLDATE